MYDLHGDDRLVQARNRGASSRLYARAATGTVMPEFEGEALNTRVVGKFDAIQISPAHSRMLILVVSERAQTAYSTIISYPYSHAISQNVI